MIDLFNALRLSIEEILEKEKPIEIAAVLYLDDLIHKISEVIVKEQEKHP